VLDSSQDQIKESSWRRREGRGGKQDEVGELFFGKRRFVVELEARKWPIILTAGSFAYRLAIAKLL